MNLNTVSSWKGCLVASLQLMSMCTTRMETNTTMNQTILKYCPTRSTKDSTTALKDLTRQRPLQSVSKHDGESLKPYQIQLTNVTISAYCICRKCTNAKGINAAGHHPREGTSVAGPRWIPLGTAVSIRLYPTTPRARNPKGSEASKAPLVTSEAGPKRAMGHSSSTLPSGSQSTLHRVVDDRLAKKYDGRFDLYFTSHQAALNFGIRRADVTLTIPNNKHNK